MLICILHTCSIVWWDVGIRLVLFSGGGSVSETFEGFADIAEDGKMDLSFVIITIHGDVEIPGAFVLNRDFVVLFEDACEVLFVFLAGICLAIVCPPPEESQV